MQRLTTDEQLEQIWEAVIESGNAPIRTVDSNGDSFVIFDGWDHVRRVRDVVVEVLPTELVKENEPFGSDPDSLEWAIGEFGFDDQYSTCSNCYAAIDFYGNHFDYWRHSVTGEITCGNCLRREKDWADDYLTDMAYQLREDGDSIIVRLANPGDHEFVCINGESSKYYGDDSNVCLTDHPDYDSRLTYADREWMQRLGKAAELIDSRLQIVYSCEGGANLIWVRFNPNENVEFSFCTDNGEWDTQDGDMGNMVLGYAIGRVIAKWVRLQDKAGWK